MSGGPGYASKNITLETDLMLGFLPDKFGGDELLTITAKQPIRRGVFRSKTPFTLPRSHLARILAILSVPSLTQNGPPIIHRDIIGGQRLSARPRTSEEKSDGILK